MRTQIVFLKVAGWICLLFMIFHAAFYKMFHWETNLSCLNNSDRAILLTYHAISILILGFMTFISLFQAKELLNTRIKYSVLGFFTAFFIIRIITEFTYFGVNSFSPVILIMCGIPVFLFGAPVFMKTIK